MVAEELGCEVETGIEESQARKVTEMLDVDDLENLQLRATLFNGLGIRLLRSENRELGLRTGLGIRYENFEEEGPDINSPSLSVGLTYRDRLFDAIRLQQSFRRRTKEDVA